ncbi:TonB-dependent receptor [Candidatus Palauibacter sp.]|uniref:TonB-dependent receptor n=1 Tax=Candidatus Palauibacter sp. TaxID=3101350 RepID=UPI003B5BDB26
MQRPRVIRCTRFCGFSVLVAVLALGATPGAALAQGGLDVIVQHAETGSGLARAQVSLPGLGYGGITDFEGHFHIANLPPGPVEVEVRLLGYSIERREATIVDGEVVQLDVPLVQTVISVAGLVAVGSRSRPRTATESMVPIDAISPSELLDQSDTDIGDLLRTTIPSYNINPQATGDAAKIIRPANLRGLAPDHTLVLVNGKRRHRAAAILWIGNGVADGAQGPDLSSIPAIALRQVEVLRDGASAQYGSDAIAGVMNFHLKDARSGGALQVRGGGFGDGGGEGYTVSGNAGLPLGAAGFANLSAEYGRSDATSRSVQRGDAALLVAAGNTHVGDPAQIWGAPKIEDDLKLWGNFGYFLGSSTKVYAHTNYASQRVTGGFFFRNPNTRRGVFSVDGGETLLIGDLLDAQDGILDGSAGCPEVRVTDGLPDQAALGHVLSDPNCFTFQERFPGGFTPQFGADVTDVSLVAGVEGQAGRLHWDVSGNYGANEVDFFIFNTVNASLGPATPVEFDPGLYQQVDIDLHVDAAYTLSDMIDVAAGVEWRDEHFTIGLGQDESWTLGPLAPQGFSAGSNGFPGFSPIAAGDWHRTNTALYADAELHDYRNDRWTLGGALRFEDFEDFGSTLNGKLAGRYGLSGALALRGSVSTGFRAPTPGQQNAFNVSTLFDRELGDLVNSGTIPSTSRVAELKGGVPLDAEKSRNFAVGAVLDGGDFLLTADYFRVVVSDRIALTQRFTLTPDEQTRLVEEGIVSARNLQEFRFFTNDFSTRTQGIDIVATYAPPALGGGTSISFAVNHTNTRVTQFDPDKVDDTRIRQLEEALPATRWILTGKHRLGRLGLLGRVSSYDGWFDARDDRSYPGEYLLDLEASWSIGESLTFSAGGQNVLNTYPQENPGATFSGNRYGPGSPFGSNGGFYYARLGYRWN